MGDGKWYSYKATNHRIMKPEDNTEEAIVKEILSGKYRNHYLVYNRKSTDDTANQKNSIKYQKSENVRFAAREGLPVAAITLEGENASPFV